MILGGVWRNPCAFGAYAHHYISIKTLFNAFYYYCYYILKDKPNGKYISHSCHYWTQEKDYFMKNQYISDTNRKAINA